MLRIVKKICEKIGQISVKSKTKFPLLSFNKLAESLINSTVSFCLDTDTGYVTEHGWPHVKLPGKIEDRERCLRSKRREQKQ